MKSGAAHRFAFGAPILLSHRARRTPLVALVAVAASLGFIGLLVPGKSAAQTPVEPVRLQFSAVAGCPDEATFFDLVRARTSRVRRALASEEARTVEVTVTRGGKGFVGRLSVHEQSQTSRPRQVSSSACDDVIVALALMTALAIDPNAVEPPPSVVPSRAGSAGTSAPPALAPSAAASSPVGPSAPAPGRRPVAESATPVAATSAAEPGNVGPVVSPVASPPAPSAGFAPPPNRPALPDGDRSELPKNRAVAGWALAIGADAMAVGTGAVPRANSYLRRSGEKGQSLGIGLSFAGTFQSLATKADTGVRLYWATATIEACPIRISIASRLAFFPCVPVEGGALAAGGVGAPNAITQFRPWFTVGALARLELAITRALFVESRVGLAVPFVRDTFYFRPSTDIFRPAPLAGWAGLGMGVHFL